MFEGELNLYVIAGDPLTVVDTGIGTPEALAALEAGLAAHGLRVDSVGQIVLTHKHADHIGLADDDSRAQRRHGLRARGRLGRRDRSRSRHGEFVPLVCRGCASSTCPRRHRSLGEISGPRQAIRPADAGREAQAMAIVLKVSASRLEVIHTPGHTQGSICLRYGRHLFSGDHVLPTISPNIGAVSCAAPA